jgi:uncharacterized protein (DUF983 family)
MLFIAKWHLGSIFGAIIGLIVCWSLFRLYRRWTRRCRHCGSMWHFHRWHERIPRSSIVIEGKKNPAVTTTYYECNNPACSNCGVEHIEKSYPKSFPAKKLAH